MEVSFISILTLGFILGIKHAIEPDHVIAVSTKKLSGSSLSGIFWGIGHTTTLFIVGIILIMMKGEIPGTWAMSFEFLVGIMLVYLGVTSIYPLRKKHAKNGHGHSARTDKDSYLKSMVIGFIHGLAGSAAMVLLTMSTVNNVWQGVIYILIFGLGTIIGMLLFTTILGIPFVLSANKLNINKTFIRITGGVSTVFGIYYMYNLGITEGLFRLWAQ